MHVSKWRFLISVTILLTIIQLSQGDDLPVAGGDGESDEKTKEDVSDKKSKEDSKEQEKDKGSGGQEKKDKENKKKDDKKKDKEDDSSEEDDDTKKSAGDENTEVAEPKVPPPLPPPLTFPLNIFKAFLDVVLPGLDIPPLLAPFIMKMIFRSLLIPKIGQKIIAIILANQICSKLSS